VNAGNMRVQGRPFWGGGMTHFASLKFQISTAIQHTLKTGVQYFIVSQCDLRHGHLLEIQKLQLSQKNLVHDKSVDFYVQNAVNALKLTDEHL